MLEAIRNACRSALGANKDMNKGIIVKGTDVFRPALGAKQGASRGIGKGMDAQRPALDAKRGSIKQDILNRGRS